MDSQTKPSSLSRFHIWAVIFGALLDVVGTNVITLCYMVPTTVSQMRTMMAEGMSQQEMTAALSEQMTTSPILWIIGAIMTLAGGYLAGRIAKFDHVKHGLVVGVLVTVFSLILTAVGASSASNSSMPPWGFILLYIGHIVAAGIGGYLASLHGPRRSEQS